MKGGLYRLSQWASLPSGFLLDLVDGQHHQEIQGRERNKSEMFISCFRFHVLVTAPPLHAFWPVDSDIATLTRLRERHWPQWFLNPSHTFVNVSLLTIFKLLILEVSSVSCQDSNGYTFHAVVYP